MKGLPESDLDVEESLAVALAHPRLEVKDCLVQAEPVLHQTPHVTAFADLVAQENTILHQTPHATAFAHLVAQENTIGHTHSSCCAGWHTHTLLRRLVTLHVQLRSDVNRVWRLITKAAVTSLRPERQESYASMRCLVTFMELYLPLSKLWLFVYRVATPLETVMYQIWLPIDAVPVRQMPLAESRMPVDR